MDNEREFKLPWAESNHWCDHLGNPITQVPRSKAKLEGVCPECNKFVSVPKNKKPENTCPQCKKKISTVDWFINAMRDVTSGDGSKFGLFASCSRVAGWGNMPFELMMWKVEDRVSFCSRFGVELYKRYGDDWEKHLQTIDGPLKEYLDRYSAMGTYGHGVIHQAMEGKEYERSEVMDRILGQISGWEAANGVKDVNREASFVNTTIGIGGTIDVDCRTPNFILDWKYKFSKDAFGKLCKKQNADYVCNQLASYGMIRDEKPDEYFIAPILVEMDEKFRPIPGTGQVEYIPLTEKEVETGERRVMRHVDSLYASLNYDPRIMFKEGQCWNWSEILKGSRS